MEYITRYCPACKGELQVPEDMINCICMYCGERFNPLEKAKSEANGLSGEALEEAYRSSLGELPLLINDYELLLSRFTRDKYEDSFFEYEKAGIAILKPALLYANLSKENVPAVAAEIANVIIETIEKVIAVKNKIAKPTSINQFRFFLTVYLVPMLRHLNYNISEPVVDNILRIWLKRYPKYPFQKSDYESILAGFKRKGLCFITTAVCEALGKEDDCNELTAFRHFRDTYMLQTEERKMKVEEYYKVAPAIVTSINMNLHSDRTYREIWGKYLQPCLKAIKENRLAACENQYSRMVEELKHKYYVINV